MGLVKKIKKNSISLSIYFVLFFIAVNGVLDFYSRSVKDEHEHLGEVVKNARYFSNQMLRNLNLIDLGFRGFYIIPDEQLLGPYYSARENFPDEARNLENILIEQQIESKEYLPMKRAFQDYMDLVGEMIEWRKQGKTAEIDNIVKSDPGYKLWVAYESFNKKFQKTIDDRFKEIQARTDQASLISSIVRISLLLIGIPTLLTAGFRLNRDRKRRQKLFQELHSNNKEYLFDAREEIRGELDEQIIINALIRDLRQATGFIAEITKGNFNIAWQGLNAHNQEANKDNLVGELAKMRDQMIRVKQEDATRFWVTEGITRFSEIIRKHQDDVYSLSDKFTSSVVKYMGANQASLFFAVEKEQETVLELYGCYAYDRKKFFQKTVALGQGLVGQTYLEKLPTVIKTVPKNYVQITSGLGEATPSCLLILPLKTNERVEGILEIASFKVFEQHEIDMLEKVGEIIASAVVTMRASDQMKLVMASMQEQSEEMRSQEEEMRQNMEELQATQEEMARKAREYQDLLIEKEADIEEKIQLLDQLRKQLAQEPELVQK